MKKKLLFGLAGAILFIILVYFFLFAGKESSDKQELQNKSIVVRATNLRRGDLNVSVSATGTVTPINVVEIKSKASGIVESIPVETSDQVRVGQLIARLDQTDTRNAFEQALADSQVASAVLIQQENNWKRAQDLFNKNLVSQQEYDQIVVDYVRSKAALVKAQSNLVLTRQKLAETIVLSPVHGIVLSRNVSAGQIVSSAVSNVGGGTTIARVANMDEVYVIAAVDEVDIGSVRIGQIAHIVADAFPGEEFAGKVIRVAAQSTVVQNVTTFDVVVLVPNIGNKLKAGMNATITIDIATRENALLISNELLRSRAEMENDIKTLKSAGVNIPEKKRDSSGVRSDSRKRRKDRSSESDSIQGIPKFVVIEKEGVLQLTQVIIGLNNFDESEILSGLTDSSKVMLVQVSQARQESERFKERLKERSGGIGR
jgi:HlyD family secretion protein